MDANKKIFALFGVVVVVMLVFIAALQVQVSRLENMLASGGVPSDNLQPDSLNRTTVSPQANGKTPQLVTDKKQIPEGATGTVSAINGDKLTMKQVYSEDISYVIAKTDIQKVVLLQSNPRFDQAKFEQKMGELQKNINGNADISSVREALNDPALSPHIGQTSDWSKITVGALIAIHTSSNGEKELYIYPNPK